MIKKYNIAILISCLTIVAVLCLLSYIMRPNSVKSASTDNVSGYAWSETIGWISFNCTDRGVCGSSNYGVNIDSATGNFSGYAWSENIGWINFAPGGSYPATPLYSAKYNSGTNKVTGWAKALAADGNGWDGWILLGKDVGGWANQITIESGTGEFHGWTWGSDVVGWISFNCADRGVCESSNYKIIADINFPPSVTCNDTAEWSYCADSLHSKLKWNYVDDDGDPQESYQIQADETSNFSSSPLKLDTGVINSGSKEYIVKAADIQRGIDLDWDTTYYWRIKVKDNQGNWSVPEWCVPVCSFPTPKHAYPDPDFSWSPINPNVLKPVQFTDKTIFYNGASNWKWTFEDPGIIVSNPFAQNPLATFSSPGNWDVTLEATDDLGTCSITLPVDVGEPLPEWKEVIPK